MALYLRIFFVVCSCNILLMPRVEAFDEAAPAKTASGTQTAAQRDEVADTERLSKLIEDGVDNYQLFDDAGLKSP